LLIYDWPLLCDEWWNQPPILYLIPTIFKFMSFTFIYLFKKNKTKSNIFLIKLYLISISLIIIPLQSLRFDTLSIALSYKDSFYCEWLILLLIYFGKQKTTSGFTSPDQEDGRPDGWSDARNFHIWCLHVWTIMTNVRMSEFELRYLPYGWERPDGNPRRLDGGSNLPISVFWNEILKLWSNTECRPDVLLKRPDGCKLEQFKTSRHKERSGRESTLSERMML